ncbi:MAG: hypothetical protein HZA77_00065 [Candidatus Schekmanbacteria bacterium]|nr:hypothetical protein [Candidatus Schekmanbacteria bacterium]
MTGFFQNQIKLKLAAAIFFLVMIFNSEAFPWTGFNRWTNANPPGQGYIVSVDVDIRGESVYAADATEGLFKSCDRGKTWDNIFYGDTGIKNRSCTVRTSINAAGLLYYSTERAIFKSTDAGASWEEIFSSGKDKIKSFDIAPDDSGKLYISAGKAIYEVASYGKVKQIYHFSSKNSASLCVADIYFPSRIYAALSRGGMVALVEEKNRWKAGEKKLSDFKITSIAPDPWVPNKIYAAAGNNLFISEDGGENWSEKSIAPQYDLKGAQSVSILVSKKKKGLIFAAVLGGGVFRSYDGGEKWEKISNRELFITCLAEYLPGSRIIGGSLGDGIYVWNKKDIEWERQNLLKGYLRSVTHYGKNIFAVTYSGRLFRSKDNGKNWKEEIISQSEMIVSATSFSAADKIFYIAVTDDGTVYIREKKDREWRATSAITNPDKIYSLTGGAEGVYAVASDKLLFSSDGEEWQEVIVLDGSESIKDLLTFESSSGAALLTENGLYKINGEDIVNPVLPPESCEGISSVYFSKKDRLYAVCPDAGFIYSLGDELTWQVFASLPEGEKVSSIAVNETSENKKDIYAVTESNKILRSFYYEGDYSNSWFEVLNDSEGEAAYRIWCGEDGEILAYNEDSGLIKSNPYYSIALGAPLSKWKSKMVSFPVNADEMNKENSVLLKDYIKGRFRIYRFNGGETSEYEEIKNIGDLNSKEGYWLMYSGNIEGTIPGNPASSSEPSSIILESGWNLVGNPFPLSISADNLTISEDEKNIPAKSIFIWNNKQQKYESAETIKCGEAFWIKNTTERKIKLVISPSAQNPNYIFSPSDLPPSPI